MIKELEILLYLTYMLKLLKDIIIYSNIENINNNNTLH